MILPAPHRDTLRRVAVFLAETRDPWWIVGSVAMALIDIDPGDIRDIDVLVSEQDADGLMRRHGLDNAVDGGTDRFKSNILLYPPLGPVSVEVMGNYRIRQGETWHLVKPQTRQKVVLDGIDLFVPDRSEQAQLLQRLGRPKDLQRLKRFN